MEQEQITAAEVITPEIDLSTVDRPTLLAEIESIQVEIKERQDNIVKKAKLLEQAVEFIGKQKTDSLKDIDYKNFTNDDWSWVMSEGQLDDRSAAKQEFKKSI